jgi:RNA-directed DNA polymerase
MVIFNVYNRVSWEKSFRNILRIQKLLFKSMFVSNKKKSLILQKVILTSNSARLLSIRQVTQISFSKKVPGVDGKISLTFNERFELNEYLKLNFNNWQPQVLKKVFFQRNDGLLDSMKVSTVADRVWQCLVSYALEPAHEAIFNPSSFGFRSICSIFDVQRVIFLQLSKQSFGIQKRILVIDLNNIFTRFSFDFLINKLIAPRGIKLGIFRLLNAGYLPEFPLISKKQDFNILAAFFANLILDGIETIHSSVRFGSKFLIFLKPIDNEFTILKNIYFFIKSAGLFCDKFKITLFSSLQGFDFLDWHFKVYNSSNCSCTPSFSNYQSFLKRVKYIINNSNYGSNIKANKLYPIIKEWRFYHKYCDMSSSKFSLFFVQKRAFKIFRKESKNDSYSAKNLIKKCFSITKQNDTQQSNVYSRNATYAGHICFSQTMSSLEKFYFCVHCGMKF